MDSFVLGLNIKHLPLVNVLLKQPFHMLFFFFVLLALLMQLLFFVFLLSKQQVFQLFDLLVFLCPATFQVRFLLFGFFLVATGFQTQLTDLVSLAIYDFLHFCDLLELVLTHSLHYYLLRYI